MPVRATSTFAPGSENAESGLNNGQSVAAEADVSSGSVHQGPSSPQAGSSPTFQNPTVGASGGLASGSSSQPDSAGSLGSGPYPNPSQQTDLSSVGVSHQNDGRITITISPELFATPTQAERGPQSVSIPVKSAEKAWAAAARFAGMFGGFAKANQANGVICRRTLLEVLQDPYLDLKEALGTFDVLLTLRDELQEAPPLVGVFLDPKPGSGDAGSYRFFRTFEEAARFLGVAGSTLGNHRDRLLKAREEKGDYRCYCMVKNQIVRFMEEAFEKGSLGSRPRARKGGGDEH